MHWPRLHLLLAVIAGLTSPAAAAEPLQLQAGGTTYIVDPSSLKIDARTAQASVTSVMPPLHAAQDVAVDSKGGVWHWRDADGRDFKLSAEGNALHLAISAKTGTSLSWALPKVRSGTWLVPDGEGMAFDVEDPFWRAERRSAHRHEQCLAATAALTFPAWSYLTAERTVTYALGDGLLSKLCLHDDDGVQASLTHDFGDGAGTIDLYFSVGPPDLLAPALFYRQFLKDRGLFKAFADKAVPNLRRLFGAPHAYVWGDGRDLGFLDDLKALGITRIVLTYSQDPRTGRHILGRPYLARAAAQGYLAGPYEEFGNGQPPATADEPEAIWPPDLYPAGCMRDAQGQIVPGFANRGCEMSSEAIARRRPFVPSVRYGRHVADGDREVFVDVDAFGNYRDDFSPDHPMSQARDRENRLARLKLAIDTYRLVLGSESVTASSAAVVHFSHGTGQAHMAAVWPLNHDARFNGWWPPDRPKVFFAPFQPTPDEARALFGPADRLPLFEAVFHDSVVAVDRWEFGMMKVAGQEPNRFAHALLYGTPTMWQLDRRELARVGAWLKAAQDDFQAIHGTGAPLALTGFAWLTPDRLVQQVTYADGRIVIANFGQSPWQGLAPDCVRLHKPNGPPSVFCPPPAPPPYRP